MSSSPVAFRSLYRNLTRQIRRSSGAKQILPLSTYIRETISLPLSDSSSLPFGGHGATHDMRRQQLENLVLFLRSKRLHSELLERYNPTSDLTEEERVRLTARRVGLDVPMTHDPSKSHEGHAILQKNQGLYKQGAKSASQAVDKDRVREEQMYRGEGDGVNKGGPLMPPIEKN